MFIHLHVSALVLPDQSRKNHNMGIGHNMKHLENTDGHGISEKRKIIVSLIHVPSTGSEEQLI